MRVKRNRSEKPRPNPTPHMMIWGVISGIITVVLSAILFFSLSVVPLSDFDSFLFVLFIISGGLAGLALGATWAYYFKQLLNHEALTGKRQSTFLGFLVLIIVIVVMAISFVGLRIELTFIIIPAVIKVLLMQYATHRYRMTLHQ